MRLIFVQLKCHNLQYLTMLSQQLLIFTKLLLVYVASAFCYHQCWILKIFITCALQLRLYHDISLVKMYLWIKNSFNRCIHQNNPRCREIKEICLSVPLYRFLNQSSCFSFLMSVIFGERSTPIGNKNRISHYNINVPSSRH